MHDQFGLDGEAAIVTGSTRGIGRAIAERFADEGVDVTVCSRTGEEAEAAAEEIDEGFDGRALGVECDVREESAVAEMVETTADTFGGVDLLVNNAGASFMAGFDDISANGWESVVGVNLFGTVNCTREAADHLKDGGGAVVNLASVAGQQGAPYMSHYGAAKAAVVNLTSTLAYEWAGDDVRVNCVAPGYVATAGLESQMGIAAEDVDRESVDRSIGLVEEVADVTQFLCSDAASFLTGQTIAPKGKPQIEETP